MSAMVARPVRREQDKNSKWLLALRTHELPGAGAWWINDGSSDHGDDHGDHNY
jgi:hypothetical protein